MKTKVDILYVKLKDSAPFALYANGDGYRRLNEVGRRLEYYIEFKDVTVKVGKDDSCLSAAFKIVHKYVQHSMKPGPMVSEYSYAELQHMLAAVGL